MIHPVLARLRGYLDEHPKRKLAVSLVWANTALALNEVTDFLRARWGPDLRAIEHDSSFYRYVYWTLDTPPDHEHLCRIAINADFEDEPLYDAVGRTDVVVDFFRPRGRLPSWESLDLPADRGFRLLSAAIADDEPDRPDPVHGNVVFTAL